MLCSRCGAYQQPLPRRLMLKCSSYSERQAEVRLRRTYEGRHPARASPGWRSLVSLLTSVVLEWLWTVLQTVFSCVPAQFHQCPLRLQSLASPMAGSRAKPMKKVSDVGPTTTLACKPCVHVSTECAVADRILQTSTTVNMSRATTTRQFRSRSEFSVPRCLGICINLILVLPLFNVCTSELTHTPVLHASSTCVMSPSSRSSSNTRFAPLSVEGTRRSLIPPYPIEAMRGFVFRFGPVCCCCTHCFEWTGLPRPSRRT